MQHRPRVNRDELEHEVNRSASEEGICEGRTYTHDRVLREEVVKVVRSAR